MSTIREQAEALLSKTVVTKSNLQQATKGVLVEVSALLSLPGVSQSITKDTLIHRIILKLAEQGKMHTINDDTEYDPSSDLTQGLVLDNVGPSGVSPTEEGQLDDSNAKTRSDNTALSSNQTLSLELEKMKLQLLLERERRDTEVRIAQEKREAEKIRLEAQKEKRETERVRLAAEDARRETELKLAETTRDTQLQLEQARFAAEEAKRETELRAEEAKRETELRLAEQNHSFEMQKQNVFLQHEKEMAEMKSNDIKEKRASESHFNISSASKFVPKFRH